MNKPPDNNTSNAANDRPGQAQHLSDELLLLFVDGEISGRDAAQVTEHLEACWSCRARRDRLEESIADVVDYRNCLLKPYLPPSNSGRAMFVAMLDEYAGKFGRPSFLSRFISVFRSTMVPPRRAAWIAASVALIACLVLFVELRTVPTVSASELLGRARTAEMDAIRAERKPVVYQKVHIQSNGHSLTRTIYRDPLGNRVSSSDELNERADLSSGSLQATDQRDFEKELQQAFQSSRLNWSDPLSASAFSAWRDSLGQRDDRVLRNGDDFLVLKTVTPDGPIREGDLTVRAKDFRAVAESLVLQDERRIEISELAYEVLNLDQIAAAVFAPEPPTSPLAPPTSEPVSSSPLQLNESVLAAIELQARVALHTAGADLGEQVDVVRNPRGPVLVRGLANTPERKEQLLSALRGIPNLDVRVRTVDEAVAERQAEEIAPPSREVVVTGHAALEDKLVRRFPNVEERTAFVNRALSPVDQAMAHAWALRHLEERYTPIQVALLNQSGRQTLELLIRDHVATIRQQIGEGAEVVGPLLDSPPTGALGFTDFPGQQDWRSCVQMMFELVQNIQRDISGLLAGSSDTQNEPEALTRDFQLSITSVKAELSVLSNQLSGPFLSNPSNGPVLGQDERAKIKQEKP